MQFEFTLNHENFMHNRYIHTRSTNKYQRS